MNEEKIQCNICNLTLDEADVNIVDYVIDVCIHCEKDYLKQYED